MSTAFTILQDLERVTTAYARAENIAPTTAWKRATGRAGRLWDALDGRSTITLATIQRAFEWFAENWPQPESDLPSDARWPSDIARPGHHPHQHQRKRRPEAALAR